MTREELDFIGSMNMCDEISNEAYEKIVRHAEETIVSDDCVSRKAVLDTLMKYEKPCDDRQDFYLDSTTEFEEEIKELPPVTPTQCIATVQFNKEELREICNERIEIECTHGTCKDCKWWESDNDKIGYCSACKHGHTSSTWEIGIYRKTKSDFYCADFEKRGDENG